MDYSFDPAGDRVTVHAPRRILFPEVIATMNAIYDDPAYRGQNELWDLSESSEIKLSADYRAALPQFQAAEAKIIGHPRCAILCPTTVIFGMAKMYEMLWTSSPLRLKAFLDRAKAEAWVCQD